jgi:nicotinamidase-related amidase
MSAITIDKQSALVLIDPQQGILAPPALLDPDDIKTRDQRLAAASRASTLPVAQVKLAFSANGGRSSARPRPHARPGIRPAGGVFRIPRGLPLSPGDIILVKRHWGAFTGTGLDLQLRRRVVTQIVLAGISTSIGVESTARSA